jgi:outer membrane protein assembly factor BamB
MTPITCSLARATFPLSWAAAVLFTLGGLTLTSSLWAQADVPDLRTRQGGSDWPRFLGPSGDGRSPEPLDPTPWLESGPPVLWHTAVGEGYSMPSVARGRLFLFDRIENRARLRALHSETGDTLWQTDYASAYEDMYGYSGGPRTSPVIDDDLVFTLGVEGRLRAQRVVDGSLVWEVDTTERYGVQQNFFGVGATPIVEGDLLIAVIGGSPEDSPGIQSGKVEPNGTALVGFDKRTGEERWRSGDELAAYASPVMGDIADRRLGLAFLRGGLIGFDPSSGKTAFRFPWRARVLESVNAANPVVVGDRVFLTETYGPGGVLLEVGEGEPEIVWQDGRREQAMAAHWSTPIHDDGVLYGSSGRNSGNAELRAVELETGEVLWAEPGLARATLLWVDGHFFVLGEYGSLVLIEASPEAYRPLLELQLGRPGEDRPAIRHPAWNAPILSHGLLYVRGKDALICFDLGEPDG